MAKVAMEDEYFEEILGFDIRVLTNKGNVKTIRYSDLKGHLFSELNVDRDDCDGYAKIGFGVTCRGYSMGIIEE